jgi:hypothetical protein
MGLKKQTKKLFKHRASGDQLKERKAARKLEHPSETVTETVRSTPTPKGSRYFQTTHANLDIAAQNKALRTAGGKDLAVDTRPAKKRIPKEERNDDGN